MAKANKRRAYVRLTKEQLRERAHAAMAPPTFRGNGGQLFAALVLADNCPVVEPVPAALYFFPKTEEAKSTLLGPFTGKTRVYFRRALAYVLRPDEARKTDTWDITTATGAQVTVAAASREGGAGWLLAVNGTQYQQSTLVKSWGGYALPVIEEVCGE